MKHLLRPYRPLPGIPVFAFAALCCGALFAAACLLFAPQLAHAQAAGLTSIFTDPDPLMAHAGPSGYLGVEITDVDADKAQALKLKEVRGAVITLIDHDAPAGQVGLKVNDVVLAVNNQNVAGADQLRRLLREIPPGRKISLEISRDGNIQTLAVQLVDRKALDHDVWGRLGNDVSGVGIAPPVPAMGIMTGGDAPIPPSGFHMSLFTSTLNVGALVEPLTSQMADYFGAVSYTHLIQAALGKLTPRERMVFELKHYQGLRLRTIGEMLSTTEETAKNTLFRATKKLRLQLAELK